MTVPPNGGYPNHPENDPFDYGQGYQPYPQGFPQEPVQPMVRTDGVIDIMRAVQFGFRSVFSNAAFWILGALATLLVIVLVSIPFGMLAASTGAPPENNWWSNLLSAIIGLVITVMLARASIWQVDQPKIGYRHLMKDNNFGQAFIGALLAALVTSGVTFVIALLIGGTAVLPFIGIGQIDVNQLPSASAAIGAVAGSLVALVVRPLVQYVPFFLVESRANSIGEAFKLSFEAGKRNWGRLILYAIVAVIAVFFAALITLGIALIVLVPVLYVVDGHFYRQAAGGPVPHDPARDRPLQSGPGYEGFL